MKHIFILLDYLDFFYSSREGGRGSDIGMRIDKIQKYFLEHGYSTTVLNFPEVNVSDECYKGSYIMYQSTEDRGLIYKDYIEDILLALELRGAILIPRFELFRGHSNKVFQELMRDLYLYPELSSIKSNCYGSYEDFEKHNTRSFPFVVKTAEGAKSTGVALAKSQSEIKSLIKSMSSSFDLTVWAKDKIKSIIRPNHIQISHHRNKFICQDFIPDLKGDYKIVIYGNKYYFTARKVKKDDFRASGSGIFEFDIDIDTKILDYAKKLIEKFDSPYASLDIVINDGKLDVVEFQFVTFGTASFFDPKTHYENQKGQWVRVTTPANDTVENNIVNAIVRHIDYDINKLEK